MAVVGGSAGVNTGTCIGSLVTSTTSTTHLVTGTSRTCNSNTSLSRSLERLLDEAAISGELLLPARKLRDFPHSNTCTNTGQSQHPQQGQGQALGLDLHDTLIADLSKNRFSEVPEEVTEFYFLEKLLLCQNAIRSIPESVVMLQSLSYLDLSRNQLSEIPRELCQLPLQVLLLSNNRLTSLPKELGKMSTLAELDASGNMISQLPITIGDLSSLRSLNLKNNQLGLLPIQITYLKLEVLDVSCNCISSLPLELRNMTDLVVLNLEHNPLVSPPAMICVKGRIHIFKYLDNQANKDNLQRRGDDIRRSTKQPSSTMAHVQNYSTMGHPQTANSSAIDGFRHKIRYNVDSGYSTSDGGEKRWSSDGTVATTEDVNTVPVGFHQSSGRSTPSTPSTISPGHAHMSRAHSLSTDTPPSTPLLNARLSPDGLVANGDDKNKSNQQQTYRQYKEALRQQRQQDVYRPRSDQTSPSTSTPTSNYSHSTPHSPVANGYHSKPSMSSNQSLSSPNCSSPTNNSNSPIHSNRKYQTSIPTNTMFHTNGLPNHDESNQTNKRPIQKVVPSRNITKNPNSPSLPLSNSNNSISSPLLNGNVAENGKHEHDGSYSKPMSPVKASSGFMTHNSVPNNRSNSLGRTSSPGHISSSDQMCGNTPKSFNTLAGYVTSPTNTTSQVNWHKEVTSERLSFTMKREFDRAKEESDLIQQLRIVIENRLKMSLPKDLAPALADGVVLCHLANHVRPRAVASVHVPSPAQPKLSMARCRRNVDNFLEACRKIGVEEEALCCPQDILPVEDSGCFVDDCDYFNKIAAIYQTVSSLLSHRSTSAHATDNQNVSNRKDTHHPQGIPVINSEETINIISSSYYDNSALNDTIQNNDFTDMLCQNMKPSKIKLIQKNRYDEDRCVSNFNCATDDVHNVTENINHLPIDNSQLDLKQGNSVYKMKLAFENNQIYENRRIDKNDKPKVHFVSPIFNDLKINKYSDDAIYYSETVNNSEEVLISNKETNYYSLKRSTMNLEIKNNLNNLQNDLQNDLSQQKDQLISWLCLGFFIFTLISLYMFPLPN